MTSTQELLEQVAMDGSRCLLIERLELGGGGAECAAYAAGLSRASANHPWIQHNITSPESEVRGSGDMQAQWMRVLLGVAQGASRGMLNPTGLTKAAGGLAVV